jgi:hypothetical protein
MLQLFCNLNYSYLNNAFSFQFIALKLHLEGILVTTKSNNTPNFRLKSLSKFRHAFLTSFLCFIFPFVYYSSLWMLLFTMDAFVHYGCFLFIMDAFLQYGCFCSLWMLFFNMDAFCF